MNIGDTPYISTFGYSRRIQRSLLKVIFLPMRFSSTVSPRQVERMHFSLGVAWLGHTSDGRVSRYTDLVKCVLVPMAVGRGRLTWIPGSRHSY